MFVIPKSRYANNFPLAVYLFHQSYFFAMMEILFGSVAVELIPGQVGDIISVKFVFNVFAFNFWMTFFWVVADVFTYLIINWLVIFT